MKNKLLILILCFCFIFPLQASISPTITMYLNHVNYMPLHTPQLVGDNLYISADDLAAMTYGTYTTDETSHTLIIQNQRITFSNQSTSIKVNGAHQLLSASTLTLNDVHYLPVSILGVIDYPYTISSDLMTFKLISKLPYSLATDTYKEHRMLETSYETLRDAFSSFPSIDLGNLESTAKRNNQYLSFITTNYKKEALAQMKKLSSVSIPTNVYFRQINHSGNEPVLSDLSSFSIVSQITEDGIALTLGDKKINYNCFWATFNPSTNTTSIDLSKSYDAMLMRCLYEYYRGLYDLKDDHNLTPIKSIQMGRSDSIIYPVYVDYQKAPKHYEVIVYKQSMGSQINYYVDFCLS